MYIKVRPLNATILTIFQVGDLFFSKGHFQSKVPP
jgi:hypothetical protein